MAGMARRQREDPISGDDIHAISEEDALRHQVVVFQKKGKNVHIAIGDPENQDTLEYLSFLEKTK
jgi:hypothetical protein